MAGNEKYITVECPVCHKERQVHPYNTRRPKYTGLCQTCNKRKLAQGLNAQHGTTNGFRHEGYVFVKCPDNPRATREGFVKRAVLIMEQSLGRYLLSIEHLHHINGIRDDDRLENLTILTNSEHARLHAKARANIKNIYQMALA
jgi:hypothetical protein